ncbi:MAG: restriction endonuclease subunit S [Oscillospiraceae bacterium]|nr:restriction endonuclease subunit S [Oscillospiraceae bacterium]
MRYPTERLGDHIQVLSGFAFKSKDFSDEGIPVIKIKNITPPSVSLIDLSYVSEEIADKNEKFILQYDDVLIALTGSHINQMASVVGRVAKVRYTEKTALNQRVGKITVNDADDCDLDFVYYYLSQDKVKIELASKAGGAANQANISPTDIKNLMIPFPEITAQRKISAMLRAYDDLIENNQQQIKLLEEAAQRLYKEWFVDLRFPGHETTHIADGVPEGWKRERLIDIVKVQYGYAFDGSLFNANGNGTPIVRIRNIPAGTTADYTTEDADPQYVAHNGDILVGMDGEFHINSWSGPDAYLVQRTCSFRPNNPNMKGYLLQAIYEPIKYFESTVVGATVAHLGKKHIDTITVLTAPKELYVPFQRYFERRQLLLNQNRLLAEARDRLLPKLMNGEIEV